MNHCPFCNLEKELSSDHHLAARRLLSQELRKQLSKRRPHATGNLYLTVRGCTECNAQVKKDEEYFYVNLILSRDVDGIPAVEHQRNQLFMTWSKGHDQGLLRTIRKSTSPIMLPGGFLVSLDRRRVNNYLEYLVKGLNNAIYGDILADRTFRCYMGDAWQPHLVNDVLNEFARMFLEHGIRHPKWRSRRAALGHFQAAACRTDLNSFSIWVIFFYRKLFLITVDPIA